MGPDIWVRTFGSKFLGPAKWVPDNWVRTFGSRTFGSQIWHRKPVENKRTTKKVKYQKCSLLWELHFWYLTFFVVLLFFTGFRCQIWDPNVRDPNVLDPFGGTQKLGPKCPDPNVGTQMSPRRFFCRVFPQKTDFIVKKPYI